MEIDVLIKRYFPGVIVVMVGTAAWLQAQGVAHVVGQSMAVDKNGLLAGFRIGKSLKPSDESINYHESSASKIIYRNPLDSVTGDLNPKIDMPEIDETHEPARPPTSDPYSAPSCEGVTLITTVEAEDSDYSFASMTVGSDKESKIVRKRDTIGGKEVWFIRFDRVWLIGPGNFCQINMFATEEEKKNPPKPKPTEKKPKPPAPRIRGGAPSVPDDIKNKIKAVSSNEYNVDRSVLDRVMQDQSLLMRSARIVPEKENGKTVGIRLFGVRPDTLFGVLGMHNGDRIDSINGFDLSSPDAGLQAFAKLKTASHLTINVNRNGKKQNIDYNIKLVRRVD
jgi:general secretion pathway protein C